MASSKVPSDQEEKALRLAIARQEDTLCALARDRDVAEHELRRLKSQFDSLEKEQSEVRLVAPHPDAVVPATPAEKVDLFRSLFRGREDIYPKLWENAKTGRTGYAPACANEWVRGVCEKPRVRCGECPNQAFLPISDRVILDHLRGHRTIGVYPLLPDETCWFLAADFDKRDWKADIVVFREVCRSVGLPVAIERSRSGNGAHAWFFFDRAVTAATARRVGCSLITEAMSRRHDLGMSSYDRLFPNQDTLPRGGFGNLIALPLQHDPRARGNTVFVDDDFHPFPDQWAYLARVERISPSTVEELASVALRRGQVLGVRSAGLEDDETIEPWRLTPSRKAKLEPVRIDEPLPDRIEATLSQRLFISKEGLPSSVINALKRVAAFQNPEFYKKQNMRLSTALTPRVIACAEDFPAHIALPRGCVDDAVTLLHSFGVTLDIDDQRNVGQAIDHQFEGTLTELQQNAVRALLDHDLGILVAPPGVGKTVAGIYLIAKRARNTLILVHRKPLLEQWIAQLALFFDVAPKSIGRIGGGGKRLVTGLTDVGMIQSLVRKDEVADLVAEYGHVLVDECHHIPAASFERVLSQVKARYLTGLTATPTRRDGKHPILEMQLGPARYVVNQKSQLAVRPFEHRLLIRETDFRLPNGDSDQPIQRIYQALARDAGRNDLILNDVIGSLEEGRSPIVLTERKDHLDFLAERLHSFTRNLIVLRGGVSAKRSRDVLSALAAIPETEERLVLATGRYIGEGFDDARLDTLFLTMPVPWRGTVVQYTGRLHRLHPGKEEVRIYDYVDSRVAVLARMFERRLAGYRSIGYKPDDSSRENPRTVP